MEFNAHASLFGVVIHLSIGLVHQSTHLESCTDQNCKIAKSMSTSNCVKVLVHVKIDTVLA